jgi:hypothetical protein
MVAASDRQRCGSCVLYGSTWTVEPTICLQSLAKVPSAVAGLGQSALGVCLKVAASRPVGVGCVSHNDVTP